MNPKEPLPDTRQTALSDIESCTEGDPTSVAEASLIALLTSYPQQNEVALRLIADNLSDILVVYDTELRFRFLNAQAVRLFGQAEANVLGRTNAEVLPLAVAEQYLSLLQQVRHCRKAQMVEISLPVLEGGDRTFRILCVPILDDSAQVREIVLIATDITAEQPPQEELPPLQAQLGNILDRAPGAIAHCRIYRDATWEDDYISAGGETLYGYTATELIANPHLFVSQIYPEDLETVIQPALRQLTLGNTSTTEFRFRHKDGNQRWVSRSWVAYHEATADYWQAVSISIDITARKQAGFELQQAFQQQQQAIQRERLISAISQNIRQSLNLSYILTTTVEEVQQFLQADRVVIFRFNPDWSGQVVAEALEEDAPPILDQVINDPCFRGSIVDAYRAGHICRIDDLYAEDLPPCYAELLNHFQVRATLALPILVRHDLWGLLIAHQCSSPRRWNEANQQILQQLTTQLAIGIHQAELYQQTQKQAQRERLLNRVIQAIRNSLELDTIFATATTELGRLLQLDRAEIVQYLPKQGIWLNVASYQRGSELPNALGLEIPDQDNWIATQLKQGEVVRVSDYAAAADATNQAFVESYGGSWLHLPIQIRGVTWGSFSLNHHQQHWDWQDWELNLVTAIADQLAIAIQQSELYLQVQQLNSNLEAQVEERTVRLQQALRFEDLLRRITDKVRESLDEAQILQTAVRELANELAVECCNAALYSEDLKTLTICYEHIRSHRVQAAKGRVVQVDSMIPDIHTQLLQGRQTQFCLLPDSQTVRDRVHQFSILNCPLMDDQSLLGSLWLFRPSNECFDELEMGLVQQVANQCAIALRQSRLYQASLAQVTELERLNNLKDDFLSTISHELRTPLSNIRMATQMLELTLTRADLINHPTAPVSRYFQILKDECQRETSLISDLLELTRMDAGTDPLLPTPIDLTVFLPHLGETVQERFRTQQLQLAYALEADLPRVTTDLSYLERILTELLTNAYKYTPPQQVITILATHRADRVQVAVRNSGVEIPIVERDRIFERFYRIPSADPWRHSGVGLGLALVKKLAERLGGTIALQSGENQTTFTLDLPIYLQENRG
jgi:PAS domain S-box-containing protein